MSDRPAIEQTFGQIFDRAFRQDPPWSVTVARSAGRLPAEVEPSGIRSRLFRRVDRVLKRGLDVVGAAVLLVLATPLLLLIACVVSMDGGSVLFRHRRVGRGGRVFDCLKFRTMMPGAEECLEEYLTHHPPAARQWARDRKLDFDPRITPVGRFLRASSLDELPQFLNVLRGEMSLVGPRPVTAAEMADYGSAAGLYRSVRPGLTGLWQISGRNDVGYADRVGLDVRYIRERTLRLDLSILLRTPGVVLHRTGAR